MAAFTFVVGIIIGGLLINRTARIKRRLDDGVRVMLAGYELRIRRARSVEQAERPLEMVRQVAAVASTPTGVEVKTKKQPPLLQPIISPECDFCGGQPVSISSTKEVMACPKCKKKSSA